MDSNVSNVTGSETAKVLLAVLESTYNIENACEEVSFKKKIS